MADRMPCSMLVKIPGEKDQNPTFMTPRDASEAHNISDKTRTAWVNGMNTFVLNESEDRSIRYLNFIFHLDGSVEEQCLNTTPPSLSSTYQSSHQIPLSTITDLEPKDQARRAELFALGSMIYELDAGKAPFESLPDSEIQACYRNGHYPEVADLPHWLLILSCWSVEFAEEASAILSKQFLVRKYLYMFDPSSNPFSRRTQAQLNESRQGAH